MRAVIICLAMYGLLFQFIGSVFACEDSGFASNGYQSLDEIIAQRQLGDLAIGIFPRINGKPTRFLHVTKSGCLHLQRRHFNNISTADFWINNNGDWGEDAPSGTFVLATSSATVAVEQADPISFMRNGNAGRKTIWSRIGFPDQAAPMQPFRSERMPPDTAQKYFKAADKNEFDTFFPGYLAYIGTIDQAPKPTYSNDMWTYVVSGRPKDYAKFAVSTRFPKLSLMAIAFDARDDDGGRTAQTPRLNLNISGPCTYIFIDSPMEAFRKKLVIQISGEGVDCSEMN